MKYCLNQRKHEGELLFDLAKIPFSRSGSYMALSLAENKDKSSRGLYLRTVRGDFNENRVFLIEILDKGDIIPYHINIFPEKLHIECSNGYVDICLPDLKTLRIIGEGIELRISSSGDEIFNAVFKTDEDKLNLNCMSCRTKYMITLQKGTMQLDAPWEGMRNKYFHADIMPDQKTNVMEIEIEEYMFSRKESASKITFEECVMRVKNEYGSFLRRLPEVPERYRDLARYAAYINWSSIVAAKGHLRRSAMYMSKNWMNRVWCWDHCFNAIALSYNNPEAAWDQLMVMFDLQHESGCLPDCVNDQLIVWNFCKPPIHGWALKKMMQNNNWIGIKQLNEIFHPLCKWTQWWFDYMDDDKDGIPQYNHGNDSGYDNSTVFDQGIPLETPELSAFLVIQMEVISEVAKIIGKPEEAIIWEKRAKELLEKLVLHFAVESEFKAMISGSHSIVETRSINTLLTIILGKRLSSSMLSVIIHKLKEQGAYMTKYGLATESTNSVKYESDGYWRGSIWAPIILLITDGMSEVGEQEFSKIISEKFINMVAKSGFAECFNALTGEGLRDMAYTWTSSVFWILAHEYLL